MNQEQEDKTPPSKNLRIVVYEFFPIQSIQASLEMISNQRWDSFFFKMSMMGGVIFLTSMWFVLNLLMVLYPLTLLGGSIDSIILGILSRLLLGAILLFVFLWVISPALTQITEAEKVPELSGFPSAIPTRGIFALAGIFTLVGVVILRYGIIEIVRLILPQAATSAAGSISFAFTLLVFDMFYFGGLMFGFGMLCLSRTYQEPPKMGEQSSPE